jgi:hypothetical protein
MDARLAELARAAATAVAKQAALVERRPPGMPEAVLAGALRTGLTDVERKVSAMAAERERHRGPAYNQLACATEAQAIVRGLAQALANPADVDLDGVRADYERLDRKVDAVLRIAEG